GTNQDLLIIDQKDITQHKKVHFPSRIVWLYEDHDGDLWVGLLPGGVYYIEKEDFENKKLFLPGLSVTGILQDKEGGFWYTTEGNGVFYASSKKIMVLDKSVGFSDRIICLATDKKQVFVGSQSGLVDVVEKDIKVKTYDLNFGLTHFNEISDLFYDPFKKDVWIAGKFKSGKIKNGHFINEKSDMMFNAMLVDSSHVYWMATSGEFIKIENNKISDISNIVLSKTFRRLNAITQKDNNTLMLGAINGLWTYKKAEKEFRYIGYKHKMLQNRILGLGYFSDSVLVMATKGSGVLLYDKNDVTQINTSKGLCGDNVYAICIDSSTIWAATNKGLNRIDIKSMYPLQYKIFGYTNATGLPSNEINDVLKADGKIWVATNKGLSFFYPDSIENKVTNIPLYMTRILINEKDTTIRENYELAYDQNNIKINFIGIGYKNAGKMKYRYKMIGLDTNWTYTNTREVQYTTLPANKYTFVLNVLQEDGFWCTNTLMIHFNVALPFWKKWWFILSTFAVGMYGTFYLFKYRLKTLHQRRAKIDDLNKTLVSLKLKALRAQMNPHFTFNVMNSIQHFIANNDGEAANRYLSRFSKLIRLILNNSERNLVPIADEIKALELYLELEAMRFEKRFVYQIMVDKCIDILEVEIPSMLIQPYVENSIKHGILNLNRQGIIKITIEKQDHLLKCVIEDNGVGRTRSVFINKGSSHKSFGTTITQERLAAINALNNSELSENVIDLEDEYGNPVGTRVEIYIPFN
ncbi:MAG TPA: histidine kinase, partial [Bacteroidia bacterium]|nr:histidine kinase [Bacteroidia bacterium]